MKDKKPPYNLQGKHVRPFRKLISYTQAALGEKIGIDRQTVGVRENIANSNKILPPQEQVLLWKLMIEKGHNPWKMSINTKESDNMTENKHSYKDFTENMGGFQKTYKELSEFFDTLIRNVDNEIDRAALINVSNAERSPSKCILTASTLVNDGREVDDSLLLAVIQEVLNKEKNDEEKDRETSFEMKGDLYLSARLDDNDKYKMVFVSSENVPLVFETAIEANYDSIGVQFRKSLDKLGINLG